MAKILCAFLLLSSTVLADGKEKQRIILDCDFGGDIDDAFAVALILSSPEFDVLGFVMDHGNTPLRARTILKMLYDIGRDDIPVVIGKPTPGIVGTDKDIAGYSHQFFWSEGFDNVKPSSIDAADFIIENLRKYPNEIVLMTVGPVCNMKDLIEKDKDALKLAKRVVSMFGSFYMGYGSRPVPDAEWNVRADVGAAKMFASSHAKRVYAGLDVTAFVQLDEAHRNRILMRQSPLTNALCGLYSLWLSESYARPDPTLYDVVAVGAVLWPELFTGRRTHVRVDDDGYTVVDDSKEANCEILMTINKDEFIKRVMDRYLSQNLTRRNR